jgi:hypothetical protein
MRLEPLYRVRFACPESWAVGLANGWQQMFFLAEGRCEGAVTGRFRGANFPRKEGAAGPFQPDFRAVIEADDGAVIMVEWHGYGRAYPRNAGRSSGQCFIRPTASPTAGSTTRSASASGKCAHRAIQLKPDPIWSWMWPS